MAKQHPKFWMVWNPAGRAPTRKHHSRASAEVEASRLARQCPDNDFFVLKAVGGFVSVISPPEPIGLLATADLPDDDLPF